MTTVAEPDVRTQAREVFRQSRSAEMPLTGAKLGAMFERSDRWGRGVIAEVRAEDDSAAEAMAEIGSAADGVPEIGNLPGSVPLALPQPSSASVEVAAEAPAGTAEVSSGSTAVAAEVLVQRSGAWAVSWLAFGAGVVVSIAANVAHVYHQLGAAAPDPVAVAASAFWPVALLLAVEVLTRVRWRRGWQWMLARYAGTGAVATVAAIMSYSHMAALLAAVGEGMWTAHLGPLAVDGLMVVSGFALLSMGSDGEQRTNGGRRR